LLQRRVACEPEFQRRMSRCTQATETDPVDFRLRHLDDPRARDAITAAAERFRLVAFSAEGRGVGAASPLRGIRISAPMRRLPSRSASSMGAAASAWCVPLPLWIAARRSIPTASATRSKGGILQSASWTLYKSVTFDLPLFGSDAPASRVEAKIRSDVGWHQAEFVAPDRSGAVRDRMCPITAKRLARAVDHVDLDGIRHRRKA